MEIRYNKQFLKDLANIQKAACTKIERFVFSRIKMLSNQEMFEYFSKMVGYKGYYKMRFGAYRVGIFIKGSMLEFQRVLHRREIYRYFP